MTAESTNATADAETTADAEATTDAGASGPGRAAPRAEADGAGEVDPEIELARFTEWFRRRPNSFEFWEVVVTDRRLYWCRVGESFKSMLLRADTGGRGRERVGDAAFTELPGLSDANFAVPLSALRRIELREGSLLRRASLTLAWDDGASDSKSDSGAAGRSAETREDGSEAEWTLYNTSRGDAQVGVVESLARDERLAGVDVGVESTGRLF